MGKSYTVTPEMVYGADWMQKHAEELGRWEWEFRPAKKDERALMTTRGFEAFSAICDTPDISPRIILLRRKVPPVPQLRRVYGTDRVEIPADKEWTGRFENPDGYSAIWLANDGAVLTGPWTAPRLILRDRTPPTRVWFKAEEKRRCPKIGDWFWWNPGSQWVLAVRDEMTITICATRHEEVDTTPTVVTQADVDAAWVRQHGGGE